MDEFKSPQKNDDLKQLFDNYAEIVGGGIGAVLGFLAGDPIAAAFSGVGGAAAAGILKNIGQEFSNRQLSPREDFRVGKVLAIAAWEIAAAAGILKNIGQEFSNRQLSPREDFREVRCWQLHMGDSPTFRKR